MVTVTKTLSKCSDCRHLGHSGGITLGQIHWVCGLYPTDEHIGGRKIGVARTAKVNADGERTRDGGREKSVPKEIPEWCPLKHGKEY